MGGGQVGGYAGGAVRRTRTYSAHPALMSCSRTKKALKCSAIGQNLNAATATLLQKKKKKKKISRANDFQVYSFNTELLWG